MSQMWCSSEEWDKLSSSVCSIEDEPDNVSKLELTISMLNCVISRLPSPPIGALMTVELLQAFLTAAGDSDPCISQTNKPHMAFAIIRFVNYVSHAYHNRASYGLQPVHKVAAQQNVPDWLVTLRHDAAHGDLPAAHLLRNAMLAALQWTIASFWRLGPESAGGAGHTDQDAASLQQLEAMLVGPRGRHLNKTTLLRCLASETLRRPALRAVADAMVTSYAQIKPGAGSGQWTTALQSWVSAISVVCRGDLLTELLENLLTHRPPSGERHHHHAAAALWVEHLVAAYQQNSKTIQADSVTGLQLSEAVGAAGPVRWSQLLDAALRHKNSASGRLLPLLMDGLSPPLSDHRRQLLLQLVKIATGTTESPPSRTPVTVGPEQLRRLGIQLPADQDLTPVPSIGATVAPPTDDGASPAWRRCADGPEWREATEVGRLPWQHKTPLLLDAGYTPPGSAST